MMLTVTFLSKKAFSVRLRPRNISVRNSVLALSSSTAQTGHSIICACETGWRPQSALHVMRHHVYTHEHWCSIVHRINYPSDLCLTQT